MLIACLVNTPLFARMVAFLRLLKIRGDPLLPPSVWEKSRQTLTFL